MFAHEHDGANDRDGVQGIGQRHKRSVQKGRDPPDYFESDETGEHENKKCID
jgi:hypothetical protein